MAYKKRPGITMIQVCGQNMLVASRAAWENCPRVRSVPKIWAMCWTMMNPDKTSEEAIRAFAGLFKKPVEEARPRLEKVYKKLYEEGYLIEVEEDVASASESVESAPETFVIDLPEEVHDAD